MGNAIHAVQGLAAPKIEWTLGVSEGGSVWARIRDNGPGIPESIRPRIFAPFSTTKAQGTGLGLSWVKRVVEEHSGRIEVQPQGGESFPGASFLVTFPGEGARESVDVEALSCSSHSSGASAGFSAEARA